MKSKISINLDTELIDTIKRIANNKGITQTEIITEYIKQGIQKEPQINKIKLKTLVKQDPNASIDDMIGTIKAPKGFNSVKAINEVRKGEY
jgi:metal-responsive CopG/Arc/MetJ family transcriptional regulator